MKLWLDGIRGILKSLVKVLAFESNINIDDHKTLGIYLKLLSLNPIRVYKAITGKELNIGYADVVLTTVCTLIARLNGADLFLMEKCSDVQEVHME